ADDLEDLINIVEQSTTGGYNKADTVIDSNGNRKITFYNWSQFLDQFFTAVPSILMQHHFVISHEFPGKVKIRKSFDSDETEVSIARVSSIPKTKNGELILPDIILPHEISLERQWYLYEELQIIIDEVSKRNNKAAEVDKNIFEDPITDLTSYM
ncbi:41220_t:CDS:2, partial [Gigaspora margarita]